MYKKVFKKEEEFEDECPCAYRIYKYVETIETDVKWWFHRAYDDYDEDKYTVIFTSYITEEYKDYILSVEAKRINNEWQYRIIKKIDGITK
jgi:hypothetical protein